ncbi:MAG: hypothetical protein C0596_02400 [Marinilabiliales bacterium]|nr:MAG: hypothetical protein C0596_02400 [Marinilabiliales bacterium]
MKNLYLLFGFIIAVLVFSSCEEHDEYETNVSVDKISLNDSIKIRNFAFKNIENGLLCGGTKNTYGAIYLTSDAGRTWTKTYQSDSLSVNNLYYLSDSIVYACGDSLMILKSYDGGLNWSLINLDNLPFEEYRVPYHEIYANSEDNLFLVGGESFYKGIWSETETGNYPWTHDTYDNEMASMCFVNENIGFFGGYGLMLVTEDGGETFDYIDFENDFFIDMEADEHGNVYAVSDIGILYYSSDLGYNWSLLIDDYNAEFSDMYLGEETSVVCGWNGILYMKKGEDGKWLEIEDIPEVNYYCTYVNSRDEIFLGSDDGQIYILNKKRIQ